MIRIPRREPEPMSAIATKTTYTPEELLAMPDEKNYELVDGRLVERNVSTLSSWVGGRLSLPAPDLSARRAPAGLGLSARAPVISASPTLRRRSASPTSRSSAANGFLRMLSTEGLLAIAPDLAVEVISPNDLAWEIDQKVAEYLSGGRAAGLGGPSRGPRGARPSRRGPGSWLSRGGRDLGRGRPARLPLPRRARSSRPGPRPPAPRSA